MKISYNWLKKYIDINFEPLKLSELLTDCGLEVEGLEKYQSIKGGLEGVVIGEVITKEKHPNADKLSLTTVDVGSDKLLNIVCGAPNVAAGQKVIVATIGTTLYFEDQSFEIKKTKIRGEISEGMICAEDELGLGTSHEGIMILDPNAEIGVKAKEYFKIENDYIYEIGLTPNRSDATSHIGVARDLVAVFNCLNSNRKSKLKIPSVKDFKIDNNKREIDVIIEDTEACPRYSGITISGIQVKESPQWLKNHLKTIGVRPINNIVDIANFVLFETGQPLHAFDADEIRGEKVIIKKLAQRTKFTTLDEIERELTKGDLMICNESEGMCIAGVFGGTKSGVTEKTKNIFLESAYFDPKTIRKTSKYHALQTDASFRFERGADPNITVYALKRAAMLIKEIAGGSISSEIMDVYPGPINKWTIDVFYKNIDRLIGKSIKRKIIKNILNDLGIDIIQESVEGLKLSIPTFKVDVRGEADIIEEILRIYGYNNVEFSNQVKSSLSFSSKPDKEKIQNLVSGYLCDNGFSEIINNSLINSAYIEKNDVFDKKNDIKILNPISNDLDVLRQSLFFGGLETVAYNQNRKITDLKLFEFGNIYFYDFDKFIKDNPLTKYFETKHLTLFITGQKHKESWSASPDIVDFYYLKAFVNNILKRLSIDISKMEISLKTSSNFQEGMLYTLKKSELVEFGSVSKNPLKDFGIKQEVFYADFNWDLVLDAVKDNKLKYHEISKYPEVRRDLALLIDKNIQFEDIEKLAYQTEKQLLKSVNLFDIYEGDKIEKGKKSYAVSFILQNPEKTLTDKIVDKVMNRLISAFEKNFNAKIR